MRPRGHHLLAVPLLLGALLCTASPAQAMCSAAACTAPVGLPLALPFTSGAGGVAGTGFTLVDGTTEGAGLLPDRLALVAGRLRITTTAGISIRTVNSQDNALGVAVPADDRALTFETSLVAPPAGTGSFEQAGLWYGASEDDYVKLVLVSRYGTRVHMLHERAGMRRASVYGPPMTAQPGEVTLRLRIDRAGHAITGAFAVEGGPARAVARWPTPAGLDEPGPRGPISRAGIFATHRLGPQPVVYAFDRFEVRCADEGCPAGPAPPDPDHGDDEEPIGEPEEPGEDEEPGEPEEPGEDEEPGEPEEPGEDEEPPPSPGPGDDGEPRPAPATPSPGPGTGGAPSGAPARHTASVSVRARVRRRALLRRGLRARVGCSEACRATVTLLARKRVIARGAGAAPGRIAMLPTRRAARRLRGVRRLRVRVVAAFADGSTTTAGRRVRLKR